MLNASLQMFKQSFKRPSLLKLVGGLVALVLTIFIIHYFRKRPELFQSLQSLKFQEILLAMLFDMTIIALFALRTFQVLKRFSDWSLPYWTWLRIHVIGQFLNFFISQAGDVYRANAAKRKSALPYTNYAAVFLFISWLDMIVTFTLATVLRVAIPMDLDTHALPVTTLLWFIVGWTAVAPVGTVIFLAVMAIPWCPQTLRKAMGGLLTEFWRSARDFKLTGYLVLLSLLTFSIMTLMVLVIFQGLGSAIVLYQAALLLAVYRLSQAVMLTPGNLGVREWSIGGACLLLGLDPGHGLLFSLIMRAIHLMAIVTTGGILMIRQRFRWSF